MSRERPGHTLQTTVLVNDAYLQLADQKHPQWQNRAHFFAVAAQLMRRIMVDHARQRQALKRGGGAMKVTLDESAHAAQSRAVELLALDEALEKLAAFDKRKADVVEMRYFGGLTMEEIADVLKVHVNTVTREWSAARAWLFATLSGEDRKSTRLNSSHANISYAVFCLKKKTTKHAGPMVLPVASALRPSLHPPFASSPYPTTSQRSSSLSCADSCCSRTSFFLSATADR